MPKADNGIDGQSAFLLSRFARRSAGFRQQYPGICSTRYDEVAFSLGPSDWIVLTTDGVTEARQGRNFLGYEGLMRLAQQGRSPGSLQNIGQTILEGARALAGEEFKDSTCVLLARRS